MSSPTPQDFEKAKVKRWMLELAVDNTNHNEIIGAKLVPNEMGGWVMLEDYYRLESEKSLLEKRVAVLEDMERQVMDLSHPNFKELQANNANLEKRVRELESKYGDITGCGTWESYVDAVRTLKNKFSDSIKALEAELKRRSILADLCITMMVMRKDF